jgi:hypothetical protein
MARGHRRQRCGESAQPRHAAAGLYQLATFGGRLRAPKCGYPKRTSERFINCPGLMERRPTGLTSIRERDIELVWVWAYGPDYYSYNDCWRMRERALATGSPYWWSRYNYCVGYY